MIRAHRLPTALRAAGLLCLALLAAPAAHAAPPGQALVIGEANYANLPPLPACALSARSVATALRGLGFSVEEQVDASSAAIFAGIATLTRQLQAHPEAPVFVYVCSYVTAFDERPFLLPVSAAIHRPADVLTQGLLEKSLLDAVTRNSKATGVVALDAIPAPEAPALSLDRLADGLPPKLGLIAVQDRARPDQPTRFAATLVPMLHGALTSSKLLAGLKGKLAGVPDAKLAALHMPSDGLYLAEQPVVPTAAPAAAPASAPAVAPPATAAAAGLPDQDQFDAAQRQAVQQALTKLGYYHDGIDGIFGPRTQAAIRAWQQQAGVPVTGHLTAAEATRLVGG